MKRNFVIINIIVLLSCLAARSGYSKGIELVQQIAEKSNVLFKAQLPKHCLAGEEIILTLSLKNNSTNTVYFARGGRFFYDIFDVMFVNSKTNKVSLTKFGEQAWGPGTIEYLGRRGIISLLPNDEVTFVLNLWSFRV